MVISSEDFVTAIKEKLAYTGKGRKIIENAEAFQLREKIDSYNAVFDGKNEDIEVKTTYFWNENP